LQLSAGWNTNQPVNVTRYVGVIIMSGENSLEISMVHNAHKGVWLSKNDNPYKIKWGTLRMDLHQGSWLRMQAWDLHCICEGSGRGWQNGLGPQE